MDSNKLVTMNLAINESLAELQTSLTLDIQMLRNYRTALVKEQFYDRVDTLKSLEQSVASLIEQIEKSILI